MHSSTTWSVTDLPHSGGPRVTKAFRYFEIGSLRPWVLPANTWNWCTTNKRLHPSLTTVAYVTSWKTPFWWHYSYTNQKWPRIYSVYRNHNPVLSSFKSNTTGATYGAGTAYPSRAHKFIHESQVDSRVWTWRRLREGYARCSIQHIHLWGGGIVMTFITSNYQTMLHVLSERVNAHNYRDTLLETILQQLLQSHLDVHVFQYVYHNQSFTGYINVMGWPSLSLDCNFFGYLLD